MYTIRAAVGQLGSGAVAADLTQGTTSPQTRTTAEGSRNGVPFQINQIGDRLEIMASVDLKGLGRILNVLEHYKSMLKLLTDPIHGEMATEYEDTEEGRRLEERDREREDKLVR